MNTTLKNNCKFSQPSLFDSFDLYNKEYFYEKQMKKYISNLTIEYQKNYGIFYTDLFLAKKMFEDLPIKKDLKIIDPCCGIGSFLLVALEKGYNNIYGADIDSQAIKICQNNVGTINNIKLIDTLGNNGRNICNIFGVNNNFDIVIGNPPYVPIIKEVKIRTIDKQFLNKVKYSGNNLFVAALFRSFELLNEKGIVSYIVPKNFLHVNSYSLLRKEILKNKSIISIIDIGAYFKNVRGEQIIITIKNKKVDNNKIILKKLVDKEFKALCVVEQKFYSDEIILFNNISEVNIYTKLLSTNRTLANICTGYIGRGKSNSNYAIYGKDIRKFGLKNRKIPLYGNKVFIQNIYSSESGIIASFGGDLEANQTVTVFTDGNVYICRYILGILHSNLSNYFLYKYCYNNSKLTMHTDAKYLKKISLPKKYNSDFYTLVDLVKLIEEKEYLSKIWFILMRQLNNIVYKCYNLTEEEIIYIENEINKIHSKKWLNNGE